MQEFYVTILEKLVHRKQNYMKISLNLLEYINAFPQKQLKKLIVFKSQKPWSEIDYYLLFWGFQLRVNIFLNYR